MTANEAVKRFVEDYAPRDDREIADREQMLRFFAACPDAFERENTMAHFTASSWIVDKKREKALMIYHNLYDTWAWTGGHADGDTDLLAVALREAHEETGVIARPVSEKPVSLESIHVSSHIKRGRRISSHIHMNITFLLEADPDAPLRIKEDENSGVAWIPFEDVCEKCAEPAIIPIYQKLMDRAKETRIED